MFSATVGATPLINAVLAVQAVERAFRARAVIPADVDDQCIVELAGVLFSGLITGEAMAYRPLPRRPERRLGLVEAIGHPAV
jgi:hypothetical protein